MGLSKWTASCFGFFEARYHAYVEIAWYFMFFAILALVQGIWAMITMSPVAMLGLVGLDTYSTCNLIEQWLRFASYWSFAEAGLSLICAMSIPSVMRSPRWALSGLSGLSLYGLLFFSKGILAMLGVMWIFGEDAKVCESPVPTLFYPAQKFMYGFGGCYLFQLMFGSLFVMHCGLADVWQEAMHNYDEASEPVVEYVSPEERAEKATGVKQNTEDFEDI